MLLQNHVFIAKSFSTSTNILPWRARIKQHQLASQISALLLQRRNWVPLLETLDLSSHLDPPLFLRVLRRIETNPQISLGFFNWVKARLGFEADLRSHCHMVRVLVGSGDPPPARPILDSLAKAHSASRIADSMMRAAEGSDSCQSSTLSFVVERYSHNGLSIGGLEVFKKMRVCGLTPSVDACNALLDALQRKDEITLAWCFYGAMIRGHVLEDRATWSLIAQILSKGGKFGRIVALLDLGIYGSVLYNVVIDHYSKNGEFGAAFGRLAEMCDRRVEAGFGTYSSILDGACRHRDVNVTEKTIGEMVEKGFLSPSSLLDYDSVIQKLSDLGKAYAAEMFFEKARENKVKLLNATYGCLLRAMSKESRVKEAIRMYRLINERGIVVNDSCYNAFLDLLCEEDPLDETSQLVRELITRGLSSRHSGLSNFLASQCRKRRWKEAEDLLNLILEKGLSLDTFCCSSLVKRSCSIGQTSKAVALHNKIEKLESNLDESAYNILIEALFRGRDIDEAVRIFDHMRRRDLVSSASFSIMIRGLCRIKELRKAMTYHDEMLEMGLKPDKASYKRLISGFR
ncbi:pentatricopeptide repeat-containing protein At4g21170 [Syzygium oleosum]|uniref:pentatricopeptide repeat-containing protein At4g21170 n=1 Tax=Syzygium oleosum TaxID=219896 RepID=UPI0011D1B5EB|nr:pentatricopeptide repeat-containing protein At4g21170 [Syzygium oleosum]